MFFILLLVLCRWWLVFIISELCSTVFYDCFVCFFVKFISVFLLVCFVWICRFEGFDCCWLFHHPLVWLVRFSSISRRDLLYRAVKIPYDRYFRCDFVNLVAICESRCDRGYDFLIFFMYFVWFDLFELFVFGDSIVAVFSVFFHTIILGFSFGLFFHITYSILVIAPRFGIFLHITYARWVKSRHVFYLLFHCSLFV